MLVIEGLVPEFLRRFLRRGFGVRVVLVLYALYALWEGFLSLYFFFYILLAEAVFLVRYIIY